MKPFTAQAHINSLQGKKDEITVLEKKDNPNQPYYIVEYRGVKCTAQDARNFCQAALTPFEQKLTASQTKFIFNWFTCQYYADDVYGRIKA